LGRSTTGVILPRALYDFMLAQVIACLPEEACGILGGRGDEARLAFFVENELHSPVRYRMRAQEQLRVFLALEKAELELVAIWHSHPSGPAHLSPTDLAEAFYPEAALLLWSPNEGNPGEWQLRAFRITGGQITEEALSVR
jgi:[CysO sulfur-carrier protein]-S-L-cysteine hydrolase